MLAISSRGGLVSEPKDCPVAMASREVCCAGVSLEMVDTARNFVDGACMEEGSSDGLLGPNACIGSFGAERYAEERRVPPICECTVDGTGKVGAFESRGSRDLIALPPELGADGYMYAIVNTTRAHVLAACAHGHNDLHQTRC